MTLKEIPPLVVKILHFLQSEAGVLHYGTAKVSLKCIFQA